MHIRVECYSGYRGEELPRRIYFDGRVVQIVDIFDQWVGEDYRYFKIKGDDGGTYILRHDEISSNWELTMFQSNPSGPPIPNHTRE